MHRLIERLRAELLPSDGAVSLRVFLLGLFIPLILLLTTAVCLLIYFNRGIVEHSDSLSRGTVQKVLLAQRSFVNLQSLRHSLDTLARSPSFTEARRAYIDAWALLSESSLDERGRMKADITDLLTKVQAAWDERQKLSDLRDSVYMQWKFFHGFGLMAYHLSGSATQDFPDVMTESDRVLLAESDELALEGRTDEIYRAVYPLCDPKGAHATQANSHACREFTKSYRRIKTELSHLTSADASFLRRVGEMNDATARLSQSFIVLETEDLLKEVDIISDIAQQARPIFILFIGAVAIMITVLILGFVALVKPLHRVTRAIQDFRGTNRTPERNIRSSLREINEVVQWVWMLFEKLTDEEARSRELFANYRELLTTSNQDALTGIANRRALNDFISRTTDVPPGLGILMIDIDLFKSLNDTRGHILGDRVLRTLASVLDRSISTKDEVFRYGGEEFCVICTGTDDEMLARTSERLLRAVRTISRESGLAESEKEAAVPLTVSIGVAPVTQAGDGRTIVQMIHEADEALYRAKRNGRNRIETGPDDETEPADEERA